MKRILVLALILLGTALAAHAQPVISIPPTARHISGSGDPNTTGCSGSPCVGANVNVDRFIDTATSEEWYLTAAPSTWAQLAAAGAGAASALTVAGDAVRWSAAADCWYRDADNDSVFDADGIEACLTGMERAVYLVRDFDLDADIDGVDLQAAIDLCDTGDVSGSGGTILMPAGTISIASAVTGGGLGPSQNVTGCNLLGAGSGRATAAGASTAATRLEFTGSGAGLGVLQFFGWSSSRIADFAIDCNASATFAASFGMLFTADVDDNVIINGVLVENTNVHDCGVAARAVVEEGVGASDDQMDAIRFRNNRAEKVPICLSVASNNADGIIVAEDECIDYTDRAYVLTDGDLTVRDSLITSFEGNGANWVAEIQNTADHFTLENNQIEANDGGWVTTAGTTRGAGGALTFTRIIGNYGFVADSTTNVLDIDTGRLTIVRDNTFGQGGGTTGLVLSITCGTGVGETCETVPMQVDISANQISAAYTWNLSPTLVQNEIVGLVLLDKAPININTCTAALQGAYWWDSTDLRFEFCENTSGAPALLGSSPSDVVYAVDHLIANDWGQAVTDAAASLSPYGGIVELPNDRNLNQDTQINLCDITGVTEENASITIRGHGANWGNSAGTRLVASAALVSSKKTTGSATLAVSANTGVGGRDVITRTAGNFRTDGFRRGMVVELSGFASGNTGTSIHNLYVIYRAEDQTLTVEKSEALDAGLSTQTAAASRTVQQAISQVISCGRYATIENVSFAGTTGIGFGVELYSDNDVNAECTAGTTPYAHCNGAGSGTATDRTVIAPKVDHVMATDHDWANVVVRSAANDMGQQDNVVLERIETRNAKAGVLVDNLQAQATVKIEDSELQMFDRYGVLVTAGGVTLVDHNSVNQDGDDCALNTFGECSHVYIKPNNTRESYIYRSAFDLHNANGIIVESAGASPTVRDKVLRIESSQINAVTMTSAHSMLTVNAPGTVIVTPDTIFNRQSGATTQPTISLINLGSATQELAYSFEAQTDTGAGGDVLMLVSAATDIGPRLIRTVSDLTNALTTCTVGQTLWLAEKDFDLTTVGIDVDNCNLRGMSQKTRLLCDQDTGFPCVQVTAQDADEPVILEGFTVGHYCTATNCVPGTSGAADIVGIEINQAGSAGNFAEGLTLRNIWIDGNIGGTTDGIQDFDGDAGNASADCVSTNACVGSGIEVWWSLDVALDNVNVVNFLDGIRWPTNSTHTTTAINSSRIRANSGWGLRIEDHGTGLSTPDVQVNDSVIEGNLLGGVVCEDATGLGTRVRISNTYFEHPTGTNDAHVRLTSCIVHSQGNIYANNSGPHWVFDVLGGGSGKVRSVGDSIGDGVTHEFQIATASGSIIVENSNDRGTSGYRVTGSAAHKVRFDGAWMGDASNTCNVATYAEAQDGDFCLQANTGDFLVLDPVAGEFVSIARAYGYVPSDYDEIADLENQLHWSAGVPTTETNGCQNMQDVVWASIQAGVAPFRGLVTTGLSEVTIADTDFKTLSGSPSEAICIAHYGGPDADVDGYPEDGIATVNYSDKNQIEWRLDNLRLNMTGQTVFSTFVRHGNQSRVGYDSGSTFEINNDVNNATWHGRFKVLLNGDEDSGFTAGVLPRHQFFLTGASATTTVIWAEDTITNSDFSKLTRVFYANSANDRDNLGHVDARPGWNNYYGYTSIKRMGILWFQADNSGGFVNGANLEAGQYGLVVGDVYAPGTMSTWSSCVTTFCQDDTSSNGHNNFEFGGYVVLEGAEFANQVFASAIEVTLENPWGEGVPKKSGSATSTDASPTTVLIDATSNNFDADDLGKIVILTAAGGESGDWCRIGSVDSTSQITCENALTNSATFTSGDAYDLLQQGLHSIIWGAGLDNQSPQRPCAYASDWVNGATCTYQGDTVDPITVTYVGGHLDSDRGDPRIDGIAVGPAALDHSRINLLGTAVGSQQLRTDPNGTSDLAMWGYHGYDGGATASAAKMVNIDITHAMQTSHFGSYKPPAGYRQVFHQGAIRHTFGISHDNLPPGDPASDPVWFLGVPRFVSGSPGAVGDPLRAPANISGIPLPIHTDVWGKDADVPDGFWYLAKAEYRPLSVNSFPVSCEVSLYTDGGFDDFTAPTGTQFTTGTAGITVADPWFQFGSVNNTGGAHPYIDTIDDVAAIYPMTDVLRLIGLRVQWTDSGGTNDCDAGTGNDSMEGMFTFTVFPPLKSYGD